MLAVFFFLSFFFIFFLSKAGKNSTWVLDQYFNPHEKSYDLKTILNWYEKNNVEVLNTLPFHWDTNSKLIEKKELKTFGFIEELLFAFNRNQIKENGFFVVIGKKR